MRTIKQLINPNKNVYIVLRSKAMQYRFMSDADREEITFSDGVRATERIAGDIMALLPSGYICFVGWAGRMRFKQGGDSVMRVDYEKYIDGEDSYWIDTTCRKQKGVD